MVFTRIASACAQEQIEAEARLYRLVSALGDWRAQPNGDALDAIPF